jgi:hypothetical protein
MVHKANRSGIFVHAGQVTYEDRGSLLYGTWVLTSPSRCTIKAEVRLEA